MSPVRGSLTRLWPVLAVAAIPLLSLINGCSDEATGPPGT